MQEEDSGPTVKGHDSGWRRRQTEGQLVGGGFALVVLVGTSLLWLLYGRTVALIAAAVALGAVVLFVLLWAILRVVEAWAREE